MSILGFLYWLSRVVAIAAIVHVVLDNRQPAKTMAWALVIYFLPIVGVVAYIFFGINTRKERLVSRRSMDQLAKRSMLEFVEQRNLQLPEAHKPVIDLFVNQSFSLPFNNNKVDILTDGYQFFPALLRDLAQAQSHIHIDIYIFEDDALGRLLSDVLIDKARQGVEVRVVYDDVGCWSVPGRFFERMRENGIEIEPFMPVRFPTFARKANYRNHRKIIIVDGAVGYIGGMNFALRYVKGPKKGKKTKKEEAENSVPWRDTMMRVEGRGVYSLQRAFLVDWYFVDRTLMSDKKYYPTCLPSPQHSCALLLQTVTSGPLSPYPEIMQGYLRVIMAARKYVYIETPYFLPTAAVLSALKMAAQSGVDVRVLVPLKGDACFTEWASRSYLREAVESGVNVSFYSAGFLHSKLMICDDSIATCGSTNIDFRSFENNFEANVFIYDADVARRLKEVFLDDVRQSVPYMAMPHIVKPKFVVRLWESFARLFSPLL
ncbi:MAG: cardiolipin synthase [Prevotella sp.]|nr:cardiolipin synthase [Prevotella sp.]